MTWIDDNLGAFLFLLCIGFLFIVSQLAVIFRGSKGPEFRDSHVLISGGSQGLGRELARELVRAGANVSILARGQRDLEEAIAYVNSTSSSSYGKIRAFSANVTDVESVVKAVNAAINEFGPIDILIPCVGTSLTGKVLDRSLDDYRKAMDINYMGTINLVYTVLPSMMKRKHGSICFITSALALTSYIGYATYTPTKYAIRGLADTLRNELLPYSISIHIAYPVNMKTRGYEIEQETKPSECKTLEADDTIYDPDVVARSLLKSLRKGDYNIYCGDKGAALLGIVSSGMSPRVNCVLDGILFPFALVLAWIIRSKWDNEVQKDKYFITEGNMA